MLQGRKKQTKDAAEIIRKNLDKQDLDRAAQIVDTLQ